MSKNVLQKSVHYLPFFAIALLVLGAVTYILLRTPVKRVSTPVVIEEKIIEEAPAQDLLGKAELSYAGGTEGRHKNIELGIARLNGTVVAPGEEFSFSKSLGSVTEEDGFSKEKIFLNGEVTKGIGGGLCQLSTTLFQTVINSGLPVTERHNHSYSVSYYDVGLDATYAEPGPDLRFVNDTANPITIKSRTENEKVVFEIYGTSDGRIASTSEVEITKVVDFPPTRYAYVPILDPEQPECINAPQIGYTAKIIYEIIYKTGEKKEQTFTSTYKPLQRVCFITGTIGNETGTAFINP